MIRTIAKYTLGAIFVFGASACTKDEIYLGSANTGILDVPDGNVVYVSDGGGRGDTPLVEFSGSYTLDLYLRSTKSVEGSVTAILSYDPEVLAAYNAGNASEVPLYPEKYFSLSDGGKVTLKEGQLISSPLTVSFTSDSSLDPATVYALPLKVTPEGGRMVSGAEGYVILVQDATAFPGAEKYYDGKPGMKIVGVLEVNDVNPLNTMGFTLKRSGKQFFDAVVIFSANINYDTQTGRVYVSRNKNVQALLDQREKYLKPLQARGIKVILGILGNHDISGISTLSDETAARFAKEVRDVCDAYELDGVFLDDEYSDYSAASSGAIPGFVGQSVESASRLAYEIRKAQPERLLMAYRYGALDRGMEIDGTDCGQVWDYVFNNYRVTSNPVKSFPGLRQDQAGTGSWNCSAGEAFIPSTKGWASLFSLTKMREQGYGALMVYNFNCDPSSWITPVLITDMESTATDFWGDELVYDGSWYPKDF